MFSKFLYTVLTKHPADGGCGMSDRPEFYSGRGATTSDLTSEKLERIHAAIKTNVNEAASDAFIKMVIAIPSLSATDFLLTLARLERHSWMWNKKLLGSEEGRYATDFASALGTVAETLSGRRQDDTVNIRFFFLARHGIRDPKGSRYDPYRGEGY